jgi:hypothetical protein
VKLLFQPEKRSNCFGINDFARHNHIERLLDWKKTQSNPFVFFRLRSTFFQASCKIYLHIFCKKTGADVKIKSFLPFACAVASLFLELALGCWERLLTGIKAPCRQLPEALSCRMAILPFQQDTRQRAGIINGKDDDGAGMLNDVPSNADPIRLFHLLRDNTEDRTLEHGFGGKHARGAFLAGFGHADSLYAAQSRAKRGSPIAHGRQNRAKDLQRCSRSALLILFQPSGMSCRRVTAVRSG